MSSVLGRIKNVFRKGSRPTQQLPPGTFPNDSGRGETLGTITKPPYPADDDDDEDFQGVQNYNVREQTQLRGQPRDTLRPNNSNDNPSPYGKTSNFPLPPLNSSNPQFRGASSGFAPGLPMNNNTTTTKNNMNFPSNMNTGTTPNPSSQGGLPFPSQIRNPTFTPTNNPPSFSSFPPGMNPNQSTQAPSNNTQPSGAGFPPGMNPNQTQPPLNAGMNANQTSPSSVQTNPQSSNVLPPPPPINLSKTQPPPPPSNSGMNANPTSAPSATANPSSAILSLIQGVHPQASPTASNLPMNTTSNNMMNTQQGPLTKNISSYPNQSNDDDNESRLELDYPIENVLIDANIPSAVAIKINEAIEKDRLGHAYHVHRYTFEPSTPQQISFGNNQHIIRHSVGNSYHGGTRHIREIHKHHQNSTFDGMNPSQKSNRQHRRRHRRNSEASLSEYVEQLLYPPGSVVIHAQNSNDIEHLLNQRTSNNHIIPAQQSSINSFLSNNTFPSNNSFLTNNTFPSNNSFQLNDSAFAGPIFYYTAQALPNDPMRIY